MSVVSQNTEIKCIEVNNHEAFNDNHQRIVNKMTTDFAEIVQGYKNDINSLQANAKITKESTKQNVNAMRNELDQVKKNTEQAQRENMDFRGLLSLLQKEINDIKAGAADKDSLLQVSSSETPCVGARLSAMSC